MFLWFPRVLCLTALRNTELTAVESARLAQFCSCPLLQTSKNPNSQTFTLFSTNPKNIDLVPKLVESMQLPETKNAAQFEKHRFAIENDKRLFPKNHHAHPRKRPYTKPFQIQV